jgi:carboxymethylenebutenolidase
MNSNSDREADTSGGAGENLFLPEGGSGPGLVLLADTGTSESSVHARASLFAEEGYVVFAVHGAPAPRDIANAAEGLAGRRETSGGIVCVAHGDTAHSALEAAALEAADSFSALVIFDAPGAATGTAALAALPCPVVFQFGTMDDVTTTAAINDLRSQINATDGSRVYEWPDAAPGFALPGHPAFDSRVDSLAHSRTLELIRRVVGPYYDYVALFAEHIRHEFETRDVDATMATMIGDPYVNHVATLAGGVGHDMLKRFYKYHFVEQNSKERSSVTVSHTLGPDRVVLELVVRFKHDQVLDRYFPGIPPTGQTVELATVLIVKFRGDKVCHEHIYWDQGSALKQISVLDADHLPVAGAEAARKVLDEHRPSNIFMADAWATSEGKTL